MKPAAVVRKCLAALTDREVGNLAHHARKGTPIIHDSRIKWWWSTAAGAG